MRQQAKSIIEIGVFFSIVVVFLGQIPIMGWIGLSIAFVLFASLILDSVSGLIPRSVARKPVVSERRDDDLQRLERRLERAIVNHDPESAKVLEERLRSIVFGMTACRTGMSENDLRQLAEQKPETLTAIVRDRQIREILQGREPVLRSGTFSEIMILLSKIESGAV